MRGAAAVRAVLLAVCLACVAAGQRRVDARYTQERLVCVLPIVGAGTFEDPKRPLFVPARGGTPELLGFSWVATDDGRFAIVQLVAKDGAFLERIARDGRTVKAFRKGLSKREDIDRELKKLKRDFDLDAFLGGVQ